MKNIHLLPTEKPSRLTKINDELFFGKNEREMLSDTSLNIAAQNIYITSDEEIKEGDWVYDTFKNACPIIRQLTTEEEVKEFQKTEYKIILTTDQELIADGVQAIDDEFLEWFVKNPTCERVDVKKVDFEVDMGLGDECIEHSSYYKIIIPQEEHKQEFDRSKYIAGIDPIVEETLEEAADRLAKKYGYDIEGGKVADFVDGVVRGAEWQAERRYSEEDLREAFRQGENNVGYNSKYGYIFKLTEKEWFEQFKKK